MWKIAVLLGLLAACGPGYGAVVPNARLYMIEGTGAPLPVPGTRALIDGPRMTRGYFSDVKLSDDDAETIVDQVVTLWMQQHGVIVVGPGRDTLHKEQTFTLANTEQVRVGKLAGADLLIIRTYSRTFATVTLKGVSVETGEVLWTGTASADPNQRAVNAPDCPYGSECSALISVMRTLDGRPNPARDNTERRYGIDGRTLRALTCQAMNAAFRLQPPDTRLLTPDQACALP